LLSGALVTATVAMYKLTAAALSFSGLTGSHWASLIKLAPHLRAGAMMTALRGGGLAGLGAGATFGAGIAGAGLAGYGLGTLLDKYLPEKMMWYNLLNPLAYLKVISVNLGKMSAKSESTYRERMAPAKRHADAVRDAAEELTKAVLGGGAENYGEIFARHAAANPNIKTELGAKGFQTAVAAATDEMVRREYQLMRIRTETTSALPQDELRRKAVRDAVATAKKEVMDKKTFDLLVQQLEMQKAGVLNTQDAQETLYMLHSADKNRSYPHTLMFPMGSPALTQ
jgi:hypothetical protein